MKKIRRFDRMKELLAMTAVLSLTACAVPLPAAPAADPAAAGQPAAESETAPASDETPVPVERSVYTSEDGWSVRYDPALVEAAKIDEHTAQFVYLGESAGTSMVTIRCIADKQPEEVLYEVTSEWGADQEDITRNEGIFPGTDDQWGYWRILPPAEEGSGLSEAAIAGEYNGGVLLFEITSHISGDDEMDMAVSDTLSEVIASITYENFEPQEMYSYYPGTYTCTEEGKEDWTVTLREDHTGIISLDEDINVFWGSQQFIGADAAGIYYEFDIEGSSLYLHLDEDWVEFSKDSSEAQDGAAYPRFDHAFEDPYTGAICDYLIDECAPGYAPAEITLPLADILRIDDSDPEDIKAWGLFWIENFNLRGTTLMSMSGGAHHGLVHLKKAGDGYEVTSMDVLEDGSDYDRSVKEIFGTDDELLTAFEAAGEDRTDLLAEAAVWYSEDTGIEIMAYEEYGWDPVAVKDPDDFFPEYPDLGGTWATEDGDVTMEIEDPGEGSVFHTVVSEPKDDGSTLVYDLYVRYEMSTNTLYYWQGFVSSEADGDSEDLSTEAEGTLELNEDNTILWTDQYGDRELTFIRQ